MVRTIRFHETGGPEVLRYEDLPVRAPEAGEVRIRVDAIGLNRAEVNFRRGTYLDRPRLPAGLGCEAAGEVLEVGPGGHFFGAKHTLERYATAFYQPMISDWRNFNQWQAAGSPQAAAATAAPPVTDPDFPAAARSTICSPIATPPRNGSSEPRRRNTPNGRFWIGKSVAGTFADPTQLLRAGSWVSLICCIDVSSPVIGDAAVAIAEQPRRVPDQRRSGLKCLRSGSP